MKPSLYAYSYPKGVQNTPLYLNDAKGNLVPLGSVELPDIGWKKYTEQGSGREVRVRRAACGLGCRCAAEYQIYG